LTKTAVIARAFQRLLPPAHQSICCYNNRAAIARTLSSTPKRSPAKGVMRLAAEAPNLLRCPYRSDAARAAVRQACIDLSWS
jgi:hypothetical protein